MNGSIGFPLGTGHYFLHCFLHYSKPAIVSCSLFQKDSMFYLLINVLNTTAAVHHLNFAFFAQGF